MASNDLDTKLKKIFAEECSDFLNSLENQMRFLEDNIDDVNMLTPVINEVFRIVHSLKASAATLSYDNMTEFVHAFESVLTDTKDKKLNLNKEILGTMFEAVNVMRDGFADLINNEKDVEPLSESKAFKKLSSLVDKKVETTPTATSKPSKVVAPSGVVYRYYQFIIRFDTDLLTTGTDPLMFFREIEEYGDIVSTTASTQAIPEIDQFDFEKLYISWELIVKTQEMPEEIMNIFMFVKSKSDIRYEDVTGRYLNNGTEKINVDKRLGDILIEKGKVSEEDVKRAASEQKKLGEILVEKKKVSKKDVDEALDAQKEARKLIPTTVRVDIKKLDSLVNLVGELVITESRLRTLSEEIADKKLQRLMHSKCEETSRIINDLQERIMSTRMVPADVVFSQFHRLVRDLAGKMNKNIRLVLTGQETELDKNIIEKINNPLTHLVRNAIDHGIENESERKNNGKNPQALIQLKAYQKEGAVFIEVADDGKGLDRERIIQKGVERGLIQKDELLTDDQIFALIMAPGFSTAKEVTDVSGRGVGLDVVKKAIGELHGQINIKTDKDVGTTFIIRLPLTLAIIEGLLFTIGKQKFVIPLLSVDETIRPKENSIRTIEGKGEYMDVRGKPNTLIKLFEVFKIKDASEKPEESIVLNVTVDHKQYSFLVDDIIGKQQVVLKSLDDNYGNVEGFAGATILGDGSIAPIVEPGELVKLYKKTTILTRKKNINTEASH